MGVYLIYFLKVITLQSILFALYWLINRKSTSFLFNRYFLISALILPFFIPLLNIPFNIFKKDITAESLFDTWFFIEQSLPMVTINGNQAISSDLSWWIIALFTIYLLVAIPSTFKLVYDYLRIYRLSKSCSKKEYTPKGFRLLYVPTKILSFSFLNKIFLSDFFPLKKHEKKTIITHEEYHLTQRHSLDIILAELVRIICWFNPVILLIQKNLKETHEYLADRHTLNYYGRNDYASLLKSFKWQEINMMLGSAYSSSSIKKRLNMMEHPEQGGSLYKLFLLNVIAVCTIFMFACEDNLDPLDSKRNAVITEFTESDLQREVMMTLERIDGAPDDFIQEYKDLQLSNPDIYYMPYVWIRDQDDPSFDKLINSKSSLFGVNYEMAYARKLSKEEIIAFLSAKKQIRPNLIYVDSHVFIRSMNRAEYMSHNKKVNYADASVYINVDKNAEFSGGQASLAEYLKENLKYPESAKEKGIECIYALVEPDSASYNGLKKMGFEQSAKYNLFTKKDD